MKLCKRCNTPKSLNEFYKCKTSSDGYHSACKACKDADYKKWYYSEKGSKKSRAYTKEYYSRPDKKEKSKFYGLYRRYGITKEHYNKLLTEQKELCAICGNPESDPRHKVLSVDHNHETKQIRGLLCNNCNKALGQFMENKNYLQNAINYLEKYEPVIID